MRLPGLRFDGCTVATLALSRRQRQILRLLIGGQQNKEIAYELRLAETTVKNGVYRMCRESGARNRVELSMWAASYPQVLAGVPAPIGSLDGHVAECPCVYCQLQAYDVAA